MEQLIESLWATTWGKIILLGLLLIAIAGIVMGVLDDLKVKKSYGPVRKALRDLEAQWPFFSALAIECRFRTFCETFFAGWCERDISSCREHCIEAAFEDLDHKLRNAINSQSHEPINIKGVVVPKLYEIVAPDETTPAQVDILSALMIPSASREGFVTKPFLAALGYTADGDWLIHNVRFGDYELKDAPTSVLDTAWLSSNIINRGSSDTLNPVRPKTPQTLRKRVTTGFPVECFLLLLLCISLSGVFGVLTVSATIFEMQTSELRKSGEQIEAPITGHKYQGDRYLIDYELRIPGDQNSYQYRAPLLNGRRATLPAKEGASAVEKGTIAVVYDPDRPTFNCPLVPFQGASVGDALAVFLLSGCCPAVWNSIYRKDFREENPTGLFPVLGRLGRSETQSRKVLVGSRPWIQTYILKDL